MRVRWANAAQGHLDSIVTHIAAGDVTAAFRIEDRLLDAAATLDRYASRGRPGRVEGTRELIVAGTPYLLVYGIDTDTVWILHVVHGAQNWPPKERPPA